MIRIPTATGLPCYYRAWSYLLVEVRNGRFYRTCSNTECGVSPMHGNFYVVLVDVLLQLLVAQEATHGGSPCFESSDDLPADEVESSSALQENASDWLEGGLDGRVNRVNIKHDEMVLFVLVHSTVQADYIVL